MERSTFIVDRRGRHRSTMKVDRSIEFLGPLRRISRTAPSDLPL